MADKQEPKSFKTVIIILGSLLVASLIISFFIGGQQEITNYNTAIIPIKGALATESSSSLFGTDGTSSTDTVQLIEDAKNDPNVRAVIFEIDSPGGSPVASDEISQAIKSLNDDNITTVAWIREEGASGAYWIASSTSHIVANRMSIVGSIGVIGSYIGWYGLMQKYNVTYERLVSGAYKDTGTPYKPLSSAEQDYLQQKLDILHQYFIETVAANRHMSIDNVTALADGRIFLGSEAKDNGLVDELGGIEEAKAYLHGKLNETITTKEFSKQKSFLESLASAFNQNSFYIGQGIGNSLTKDSGLKITT